MSTPSRWQPVESFAQPAPEANPVDALDAVVGTGAATRFRNADGGRGIVLPVPLPAELSTAVVLSGPVSGADGIVFVHPAGAGPAADLLAGLQDGGRSVRAALVEPGDVAGLDAMPTGVSVRLQGSAVGYRLFRLAQVPLTDRDRLAAGPKPGEGRDVIDDRGRWFDSRHGGPH